MFVEGVEDGVEEEGAEVEEEGGGREEEEGEEGGKVMGRRSNAMAWYVNSCRKGATTSIVRSVMRSVPRGRASAFYMYDNTRRHRGRHGQFT